MRGVAFMALVVLGACGPTLHPAEGPGTSYPCGVHGKPCGNGMCCGEDDVCGGPIDGFQRCEPGFCCYDGPHWPGARRKRKQWSGVSR